MNTRTPRPSAPPSPPPSSPGNGAPASEYGEGNYKATRDYDAGLKKHLATHDVEREARDAAPRTRSEADDMERAETAARSRSRAGHEGVEEAVEDAGKPENDHA